MAKTIPATLAVLLLAASGAHADTLLIDGIDVAAQSATMRPRAGLSMTDVESNYGAPAQRHSPVAGPSPNSRRSRAGTTRRSRSTSRTIASSIPSPGGNSRSAGSCRRGLGRGRDARGRAIAVADDCSFLRP